MKRHQYCWKPLAGYLLKAEIELDNIMLVVKIGLQKIRGHISVFNIGDKRGIIVAMVRRLK